MTNLNISPAERAGAQKISQWLKDTVEDEGDDRPTFAAIATYITSDIDDVLATS
jgi:hypothetical protein